MKNRKILLLSATAMLALTGCNGTKKVEFSEFKDAVKEAVTSGDYMKDPSQLKITGSIKSDGEEYSVKNLKLNSEMKPKDAMNLTIEETGFLVMYGILATSLQVTSFSGTESETLDYYVGNGFKVKGEMEGEKFLGTWDKYCNLTKIKAESKEVTCNFTVSYKY